MKTLPIVPGFLASIAFIPLHPVAIASTHYPCEDISHYYSSTNGLHGIELQKQLGSIVSVHDPIPYRKVWDALMILDAADVDNPEGSSDVIEIYSLRAVSKQLAGRPDGWNREHLWPRSYGLIDAPSLSDLHNIRPADVNVNSSRGNKYYGECTGTSTDCLRPANREAALDTETDKQRWAPPLQVRGDIARSLMYMAVCYGFHFPDGNPHLQLSDSPNVQNRTMGLLSELLKWNEIDPPSREEQLRNERICSLYQHNRNPFIDHPEYANLIWKPTIPTSSTSYSPFLQAWVNEFHYNNKGEDRNEFVEIIVKRSTEAATLKLILYNGADAKMYASLPLKAGQVFRINDSNSGFLIFTTFVRLQNGPADGIALVSSRNDDHYEVIQFLSYGGTLKAKDGPAKGVKSIDLGLQETEKSSEDDSLGLTGQSLRELQWRKFVSGATPGKLNIGQRIEDTMAHYHTELINSFIHL